MDQVTKACGCRRNSTKIAAVVNPACCARGRRCLLHGPTAPSVLSHLALGPALQTECSAVDPVHGGSMRDRIVALP